jgi:putative tryptophan/tyrosine transport system substrate-binding protein
MKRRKCITLLGGAAAWPLAARAQEAALPVIGYLNFGSPESDTARVTGLRRGLNQTGYVEGRTWRSNIAGRETKPTDCQHWRLI